MAEDVIFGIPELDGTLVSYLPPGWLGLITGVSGSGTHLVAKQFAAAGVGTVPVLYYTTNERTQDIQQSFRDFGWDPDAIRIGNLDDEYYERVLMRQLDVSRSRERGLTAEELTASAAPALPSRPFSLAYRVLADLAQLDGPFRLVIDSIDFLLEILGSAEVISLVRQIRHRSQTLGGQAMVMLQPHIHDARTTGLLNELADVVVELESTPEGERYVRRLALRKIRNHPERTHIFSVEISEGGLQVTPPPTGRKSK